MPRECLRELTQLVRYAEPDDTNVGPFVAEHAGELARLLHSDERELREAAHERDGDIVDRLRVRLALAAERESALRHTRALEREACAARALERTARWFELGVALDVDVVLGDLLANPSRKTIAFEFSESTLYVYAGLLRRARPLVKVYLDLAAFVDDDGIHLRWKAGRGQLNFKAQDHVRDAPLVIELPARPIRQAIPLGELIAALGYGA